MKRPFIHHYNLVVLFAFVWSSSLPFLWALVLPSAGVVDIILLTITSIILGFIGLSAVLNGLSEPTTKPKQEKP